MTVCYLVNHAVLITGGPPVRWVVIITGCGAPIEKSCVDVDARRSGVSELTVRVRVLALCLPVVPSAVVLHLIRVRLAKQKRISRSEGRRAGGAASVTGACYLYGNF